MPTLIFAFVLICPFIHCFVFTQPSGRAIILFNSNDGLNSYDGIGDRTRFGTNSVARNQNQLRKDSIIQSARLLSAALVGLSGVIKVNAADYLVEPTEDFKQEELKKKEFEKKQLKIRKDWDVIIDRLVAAETSDSIEKSLLEIMAFLKSIDGIPRGVTKLQLVKTCRTKKFNGKKVKPIWTKNVEIAYQELIRVYNKQVAPNNKVEGQI
eukprot:gene9721-13081_t